VERAALEVVDGLVELVGDPEPELVDAGLVEDEMTERTVDKGLVLVGVVLAMTLTEVVVDVDVDTGTVELALLLELLLGVVDEPDTELLLETPRQLVGPPPRIVNGADVSPKPVLSLMVSRQCWPTGSVTVQVSEVLESDPKLTKVWVGSSLSTTAMMYGGDPPPQVSNVGSQETGAGVGVLMTRFWATAPPRKEARTRRVANVDLMLA